MIELQSHNGATHFAEYAWHPTEPSVFRRTAVWRLEGKSDCGTIFHFRSLNGTRQMWQPASLLATRGFRPFVYLGGKA